MGFSNIIDQIGSPAFSTDDLAIFQVDCLDALARIPSGVIDLTITSPPYNIGKEYEAPLPLEDYIAWSASWLRGVSRAISQRGAFWLNLGYVPVEKRAKAMPLTYLLWDLVPMHFLQEIVWNYGAGVACRHMFSPRNEKFMWFVSDQQSYTFNLDSVRDPDVKYPNQKKNGKLKCNPLGKNPTDVWNFPKVTSGTDRSSKERTSHPAQFPEAVIERIILACSNEGDVILDPFSGSGTTACVARRLRRKAIGFELRPDYVHLARQRIEADIEFEQIRESQSALAFGG